MNEKFLEVYRDKPPYVTITLAVLGIFGILAMWHNIDSYEQPLLYWLLAPAAFTFVGGRLVAMRSRKVRSFLEWLTAQGFDIGYAFAFDALYIDKSGTKIAFRGLPQNKIYASSDILEYETEWKASTGYTGIQYFGCAIVFTMKDPATPLVRIGFGGDKKGMDVSFARLQAIFATSS